MGGAQQPFIYEPVHSSRTSFASFDPRAASKASFDTRRAPRPKQKGPLVSFNQHPDSYLILPTSNSNVKSMDPSVVGRVKWTRIAQLTLRCFELVAAVGLLVFMILLKGMDNTVHLVLMIVPGVGIIHTIYGIYHLSRKASGRSPASSASYMLFATIFDLGIIPFYAYGAWQTKRPSASLWSTILSNQNLEPTFTHVVFYTAIVGGSLHLISSVISIYLTVMFRKIDALPPDYNPLEANLTSRHKRNKSSISTAATEAEKRLSTPLESKRSSGAAYEDLSRPPVVPFFHTRTNSTDSFSTYRSTLPPSRDSRVDLPSRKYQIDSAVDLKRSSMYGNSTSPKRANPSYTEIPLSDNTSQRSSQPGGEIPEAWFAANSLTNSRVRTHSSPKKGYQPLHKKQDSSTSIFQDGIPNPLEANPPTPRHMHFPSPTRSPPFSPLSELSQNPRRPSSDIADLSSQILRDMSPPKSDNFKAKYYGDLKPATPPIMIGSNREVSSGNDLGRMGMGGGGGYRRERDVSGKIAEEGRGGAEGNEWRTRFRKISGM